MTTERGLVARRPVVAILAAKDSSDRLRGAFRNFRDLMRVGKAKGVTVYVTTVQELKGAESLVTGHYYNAKSKEWITKDFPEPDVVYNRIPYRKFEARADAQQLIKSCLDSRSIQLFNPSFFNKWTLYEWLSKAKPTKSYIPKTEKLNAFSTLKQYFEQFQVIYLKPTNGKAGKGIMRAVRIASESGEKYRLIYHEKNLRISELHTTQTELWRKLKSLMGKKEYIIQQGIELATTDGKPYDLRILVQRNEENMWELTGIGARVAGKKGITTHVPRGGSVQAAKKLLRATFGEVKAKEIRDNVTKLALTVASQIEKSSGQTLGEMSMDIGVDLSGELWFFEANSKPMKFDEPKIRKKSLHTWVKYCIYLSKQNAASTAKRARR